MLPVINIELIGTLPESTIEHFSNTYDLKSFPLLLAIAHDLYAI